MPCSSVYIDNPRVDRRPRAGGRRAVEGSSLAAGPPSTDSCSSGCRDAEGPVEEADHVAFVAPGIDVEGADVLGGGDEPLLFRVACLGVELGGLVGADLGVAQAVDHQD